MEANVLWNIQLPTNLQKLILMAREHYIKIKQFNEIESDIILLGHNLRQLF